MADMLDYLFIILGSYYNLVKFKKFSVKGFVMKNSFRLFAFLFIILIISSQDSIVEAIDKNPLPRPDIGYGNFGQNVDVEPQQSKTGPKPPLEVLEGDKAKSTDSIESVRSEVTLPVPAYSWRHGCGPTALGMVVGYYDSLGYRDLIVGSGFSQTEEVNQMIASGGNNSNPNLPGSEEHYEDYAAPQDSYPNMLNDAYITAGRIPHSDNSLADFMDTSKSTRGNYYGWSWSNDVGPAFVDYTAQRNSTYQASYLSYYASNGSLTWNVLTSEIDSGRPMVFLVDSDGNGGTDHFVTVIGYRTSPTLQYGSLDTWSTTSVRWQDFDYIASGTDWGIWGGWSFRLQGEINLGPLFVKQNGTGNCSSWQNACDLQTALRNSQPGDEIWVASGTYKPTTTNDRSISFNMKSEVAIYGGFPTEGGDWKSRNWKDNITILSGDIGIIDDNSDNSYHVVENLNVDSSAVMDGFTIRAGNADGDWPYTLGAGMYNEVSNPKLANMIFISNHANSGGGMFNSESSPSISRVTFFGNSAIINGGGMYNSYNSFPKLNNCEFITNIAVEESGGGIYNWYSYPEIRNTTFHDNSANLGGGISNFYSSPIIQNVTISGNNAMFGGGIANDYFASPILENITIKGNTATEGAGIYNPSGTTEWGAEFITTVTMINSIIWGNQPDQILNGIDSTVDINYSLIQGGYSGIGNISDDPLLGELSYNGGFTQTHSLLKGSPAIDAGDPNNYPEMDQRSVPRPIDGDGDGLAISDIGAYEYAPFSPFTYLSLIIK